MIDPRDPAWRVSSYSASQSNCVEVHRSRTAIRDSKNPEGPVLHVGRDALVALLAAMRAGKYDGS